jgi:AcrR family transcriptional regulator
VARVERILGAASELLGDGDPASLTMRSVADRAGVPVGTIYQFFPDKQALVQAVALRYVQMTPRFVEEALDGLPRSADEAVTAVVDAFAAMLAETPAMRALWITGAMDAHTRATAAIADDVIAAQLRDHLASPEESVLDDWRFLVTLVSQLLRQAFLADGRGDAEMLERTRRVATLYATSLVDASSERAD